VIGDAEIASDSIAVQEFPSGNRQQLPAGELADRLAAAVAERSRAPYLD
jgi:hypothetical protein